ncbi:hypothetical protein FEM48_Zijuj05G0098800 [Ziziphus jujuba var. spinosa]|uniref:Uncharacterized protein n=1 Tax=Ziziphus jujuba var. spinosa TaxID=714518 RepID=A0A978VEA1_ZIZJJ|nr:hypothetical protein FEM48_Zijuj05G0098800 [Ziziphus jujuba var. spinosa]
MNKNKEVGLRTYSELQRKDLATIDEVLWYFLLHLPSASWRFCLCLLPQHPYCNRLNYGTGSYSYDLVANS